MHPASAKPGDVTFMVKNIGGTTHELVVIKTDLGVTELRIAANGLVDEKGKGIEVVGEAEDIQRGQSKKLAVDLKAGDYVLICNLVTELPGNRDSITSGGCEGR